MKVQQMRQFGVFVFLLFLGVANMAAAAKNSIRAPPQRNLGKPDKGTGGDTPACGDNTTDGDRPKGKPINKNDGIQPEDGNLYCNFYKTDADCPALLTTSHKTQFGHTYSESNNYCGCEWAEGTCRVTCTCP